MSISSVITRLQNAKTAIANAITAKGGTVVAGDGYEDFAGAIAGINITPEAFSEFASGTFTPISDITTPFTFDINFTQKPTFAIVRITDDYSVDKEGSIFIASYKGHNPESTTTLDTLIYFDNGTYRSVGSNVTGTSTATRFRIYPNGLNPLKTGHKYVWMCGNW